MYYTFLNTFQPFFAYTMLAVFIENTVFTRTLGTSTALFLVRKKTKIPLFCLVMTGITLVSSVIAWLVNPIFEEFDAKGYVLPLVYVMIISVIYVVVLLLSGLLKAEIKRELVPMIHMSAFNCAVLGALLLSGQRNLSLSASFGVGLGTGVGFGLATYLIAIHYDRLHSEDIPRPLRGFPITLIYIGLISMAFYGLIGHELPF